MQRNTSENLPIRYFSAITTRKVEWLWYPYIPYGKVTILQGDPGDGKTTFILNVAALLSQGASMPESTDHTPRTNTIYQSAEDDAEDTLKPRLLSAGADCSRIAFIDESDGRLSINDPRVESAIIETNARLLVIDPLQAYLGDSFEMNRSDSIRPIMRHISAFAERTGCAVVIVGHMNKASGSKGIYRGLGSIDITAAARSVLLVGRLKSDPNIRIMAQLKNSLAEEGNPIAFEIHENAKVCWLGEYDISVDELLCGDVAPGDNRKVSEAVDRLKEMLCSEAVPCGQIYAALRDMGISKRSVDRAKKNLGVQSIKRTEGWYWSLKGDEHE